MEVPQQPEKKTRGRKRKEDKSPDLVTKEKKRGPGRPPTRPPVPPAVKYGIIDSPRQPEHCIEFIYDDPLILKSIFAYFKNLKSRIIHVRCNKEGLTFFAKDHLETSRVVAKIMGEHSVLWYCEREFWFEFAREQVEKIFSTIDKTFSSFAMYQDRDQGDMITFSFEDPEIKKECKYRISLKSYEKDIELRNAESLLANTDDYKVEFTLSSKQFKKSISDACCHSKTITYDITNNEECILRMMYTLPEMVFDEIYQDSEKIKLKTKLTPSEHFQCEINIVNIKSLAMSMVTDNVRISCTSGAYLILRSLFEEKSITLDTVVNIKSELGEIVIDDS